MSQLVSQRKAALAMDMALSTLQHHIKRGNVRLIDGKVDVEIARMQLAKSVDKEQSERGKQNVWSGESNAIEDDPRGDTPLWQAKARTEVLREQLLQLELAERRGELGKLSDIEAALSAKITSCSEAFRSLADRVSPILAAESDAMKIRSMLMSEISRIMRLISTESGPSSN